MPNLSQIATQQERQLLRTFTRTVQGVKDQAVIQEIVRLLEVGNVDGVIELLQLEPATFEPIEESIRQSYRQGGLTGAEQIGRFPAATGNGTLVLRFNVRSPRAEEWLANLSSRMVTEIFEDQRAMVRERLTEGLVSGRNPRQSALDLVGRIDPQTRQRVGGFIGATSRQAEWSARARLELETLDPNYLTRELRDRRLDSAFRKAMDSGTPMPQRQIDTAVSRMQARVLRYRGQVIARTESINALRAGQHEAIEQALDLGDVDRRDTFHEWDAAGDARVRRTHAAADGQRRPIDEPFIVAGERLRYPGDPNGSAANIIQCRCREKTQINFAGQLRREINGFA